ncbi:sugar ABC transporter ATP-binding protein [Paenibacillus sp. YPG26]|uniref:sugar ABC transporter ATP-binding protein n=1 Tax=Paenibacillus sp. YPG26 TaxID=2878915 RepID=UPI002041324F|nr:sugar ABC transporter ATP-binding protein [Paenibacillus sp. YPG26]USB33713.1 sugar ABC transporter ATP-binding protein [Paenibacillus sp. YPG26]
MTLKLHGISHDFGGGPVLQEADLAVHPGEVHALLGMNGAGKSTLMHIAAGLYSPLEGTVEINGERVVLEGPSDAVSKGVVFLTQEVDRGLVPQLSVHENLTVSLLRSERAFLFRKRLNRQRAAELLKEYGLVIDVDQPVSRLSLYEKQMLSIVRAVSNQAKYLLLDEPTAAFDRKEAERFYQVVRQLQEQGIGIVLISHKLHEVFSLADVITVLRGGKTVLQLPSRETTPEEVVEAMTGGESIIDRRARPSGEAAPIKFEVRELRLDEGHPGINLQIREGEILTVFGLLGSGKTELAEKLFGVRGSYKAGLMGEERRIGSTSEAVSNGIAFVPEERGRHGIWKREDIRTHLALSFRGLISKSRELRYSRDLIASFTIRPSSPSHLAGQLSGGNQQKVAIAKWFAAKRDLVIFDEPMKGIDVAAREAIFQMIESLANQGTSILYFTAEPDEALRISDRILILADRQIQGEYDPFDTTMDELLLAADKEAKAVEHS